eukprot:Em0737g4a
MLRGPEAAALVHEPEPLFVLRDSDIEVAQEQVADSLPRKVSDLVGNEYGCVAPELPGTAADFPPNQGDVPTAASTGTKEWAMLSGNMLPTPPQEVVVEDQAVYGMEVMQGGNMGGEDDMLQPSDELGYAGSVEVETVEMCIHLALGAAGHDLWIPGGIRGGCVVAAGTHGRIAGECECTSVQQKLGGE